jgi:hypothetical protein
MALETTQLLTEMSTRDLRWGKGRPAPKADKLTVICDLISKMFSMIVAFKCHRLPVTHKRSAFHMLRWTGRVQINFQARLFSALVWEGWLVLCCEPCLRGKRLRYQLVRWLGGTHFRFAIAANIEVFMEWNPGFLPLTWDNVNVY